MATVRDILAVKGSAVLFTQPGESVLDAAILMNDRKVGSLIVADDDRLVGIITERDILTRVVAERRDPMFTRVGEVMTTQVACCRPHTPLEEARGVMKTRRIRHLPVVDDEMHLHGLISIGDLNAYEVSEQEATIHFLHEYLYGTT